MKKAFVLLPALVTVLSFAAVLDNRFNAAFGPLFHPAANVPPLQVKGSIRSTAGT
jgi:hypothetical protein